MEEEEDGGGGEINDRYNASVIMYYDLCTTNTYVSYSIILFCSRVTRCGRIIIAFRIVIFEFSLRII